MSKNSRDRRPYIRPVTRMELDQTNVKLRWILAGVFFVIAMIAFAVGINEALKTEPGWQSVRATSDQPNCGTEYVLMYDFSDLGATASRVNKELETKYSQTCVDAFAVFSPDISKDGLMNVNYVNQSPNREISVDPALYEAFELLEQYSNRNIFLAPVYVEYDRIFNSESDPEAASNDPAKSSEVKAYIDELICYTSDEQMISLDLLGNNQVRLNVAQEYLDFAAKNEIKEFIDFGWMRNAFVIDYLAKELENAGFTNGYLASYDGFTRNLVEEDRAFKMNLFNLEGKDISLPATMEYIGRIAIVFLHSYPMNELDQWTNYVYEDGTVVTSVIDPVDGVCKSSLKNMVSYSKNLGCAELVMNMTPVYLSDDFRMEEVNEMMEKDIFSVWFEGSNLRHNDPALKLELIPDETGNVVQVIPVK